MTAFFFSWAGPTLCFGSAAYAVPPSARSKAQTATSRAGEGTRDECWDMVNLGSSGGDCPGSKTSHGLGLRLLHA